MATKKTPPKKTAKPHRPKGEVFAPRKVYPNDPLTYAEIDFCIRYMSPDQTAETAAVGAGMEAKRGRLLLQQARIREYMAQYRYHLTVELARKEAETNDQFGMTRTDIAQRAWVLANTPPERTRGTIDGQVKALERIATMFGYDWSPKDIERMVEKMSDAELRYFDEHGTLPKKDGEEEPPRKPEGKGLASGVPPCPAPSPQS